LLLSLLVEPVTDGGAEGNAAFSACHTCLGMVAAEIDNLAADGACHLATIGTCSRMGKVFLEFGTLRLGASLGGT
jgi:hypothetical protein